MLSSGQPNCKWQHESYSKPRSEWSYSGDGFDEVFAGSQDLPGWSIVTNYVEYIVAWQAADGTAALDLGGSPGAGSISQSFSTIPGASYILSFSMSGNPYGMGDPLVKKMRVQV